MSQVPPAVPPSAMAMAPPPTPPPSGNVRGSRKQRKMAAKLAVAALVLGICGFIPILGLLCGPTGIILGIVALAKNTSRKGMATAGLITGGVGILLHLVAVPVGMYYAKEKVKQIVCASNLRSIGLEVSFYAAENEDAFPPDLEMLISGEAIYESLLKCPSAQSGRACDYFYSPPAKKTTDVDVMNYQDTILACDFKDNHGGKGRNVLLADGHTQWMSEEEFQQELQQIYNADFAAALRKAEGP